MLKIIDSFPTKRIAVIGDVMLDRYVYGKVRRISPEAPVSVLDVTETNEALGGAANVAANIAALGAQCDLVGVVGGDAAGVRVHQLMQEGVMCHLVTDSTRPTTVKERMVAEMHNTHLLRCDTESTEPISDKTEFCVRNEIINRVRHADAVIIADYAKGVITPLTLQTIFGEAKNKIVVTNPRGSDSNRYFGTTYFCLNLGELEKLTCLSPLRGEVDISRAVAELRSRTCCKGAIVTQGDEGLTVVGKNGATLGFVADAKRVVDVSGAGDSVIAAVTLALASAGDIYSAGNIGNWVGGIAVGKAGTSRVYLDELRDKAL